MSTKREFRIAEVVRLAKGASNWVVVRVRRDCAYLVPLDRRDDIVNGASVNEVPLNKRETLLAARLAYGTWIPLSARKFCQVVDEISDNKKMARIKRAVSSRSHGMPEWHRREKTEDLEHEKKFEIQVQKDLDLLRDSMLR